jgi:hypothetical protein
VKVTLDMILEGVSVFYNRENNKGTDLWFLADAHHHARIEPKSGVTKSSGGFLELSEIPLAGWGVQICQGQNPVEIPEAAVTMPKPGVDADRLPSIMYFNTKKVVRPELVNAKPDDMPPTLNSMVRLRGGKVVSLEPRKTKYKDSKWKFPGNVERLLTHRFQYILELEGPVTLVFTRGKNSVREWVELAADEGVVTLVLTNEDVKGHDNIIEDKVKKVTTLVEWELLHRCFAEPDKVKPTTKYEEKFRAGTRAKPGDPIGGADPMCPGGQIP